MSVPVAPKKSCYAQLQDNRNGVTNNNESVFSLGDSNANQITQVTSSQGESKTCGLADETGNANSRELENITHLSKEFHMLQGFGNDSQDRPTDMKGCKPSLTVRGELSKHTMEKGAALPQTPWGPQGPSLSGWRNVSSEPCPKVLSHLDSDVTQRVLKDPLAKILDGEEPRKRSLDRASGCAIQVDVPTKERVGSMSWEDLQPTSVDPAVAPHPVSEGGETPQKTLPGHLLEAAFDPACHTSEEEVELCPKPSTSGTKETAPSETQREGGSVLNVSYESTTRSARTESALNVGLASKEIPSHPETQLAQGEEEPQLELKCVQPRAVQELKSTLAERLACHKDDSLLSTGRKEPCGEAEKSSSHQEATGAISCLPNGSLHHLGLGRGSHENEEREIDLHEGSPQTVYKQGSASLGAADNQPTGKISPSVGRKLGKTPPSNVSPGDGQVTSVLDGPPTNRPLDVTEERRLLGSGHMDIATSLAEDPSAGEINNGAPETLDQQSSSSEAGENKKMTTSVAGTRNLLENATDTESTPAKTDSLFVIPVPLNVPTVNVTHQPIPASSCVQDCGMLGVDTGSSVAIPSAPESVQLLDTSSTVPEKSTSPSGIPKPVSTNSKDTSSLQEGMANGQVEKTDERTEAKPVIMPKPKHVRPKIITYIRRSPQALGQVDTSLVPVGLPYTAPACSMPLPKEEKMASGDPKPPATLYEKFKPDLQKPRVFSSGLMVSGIKPPGHHFSQMSEKFLQEFSSLPSDLKKTSSANAAKSNLPKSGLRPPGYSRLPAAKLAAFGFVRSSSVSSVSSSQSADSAQTEPSRTNRSTFGNEDQPALKAAVPSKEAAKGASRAAPPAPSSVATPRRSLLPAPKPTSAPAGTKKETQKDQDSHKPAISSPKRIAAPTTKLHSP
ncbi:microtubule-associated tumor suppressor candidate 2, partial [Orycteropus afer afer]|uniref:Microtubule-associated tumor suppressor candidate 2 n=1 Tax=Orycteropus afer afer TaxID=1230840 RepID=A0AC54ZFA3_ORYAF